MKLVIFEDDQYTKYLPLAWTRGVFEFRCGATTLLKKIERAAGQAPDAYLTRDYLEDVLKQRLDGAAINDLSSTRGEEVLCINARVCGTGLKLPTERVALWQGEELAVWRTTADLTAVRDYAGLVAAASGADRGEFDGKWYEYIWDLMLDGPHEIAADFKAAAAVGRRPDARQRGGFRAAGSTVRRPGS